MNEQKNNGRGIFYGVIGVATLVVAIIGATFAYFTATAGNNVITGNMATVSLSLDVSKVTTVDETKGGMIPMSNNMIDAAVTNDKNQVCVDDNGNAVCQIYKITIKNDSSAAQFVDGYVALRGGSGVEPTDIKGMTGVIPPAGGDASTYAYAGGALKDAKGSTYAGTTMRWIQVWNEGDDKTTTETLTGKGFQTHGNVTLGSSSEVVTLALTENDKTSNELAATHNRVNIRTNFTDMAVNDANHNEKCDEGESDCTLNDAKGVLTPVEISGNEYDVIGTNFIRTSNHDWTDGGKQSYKRANDVTSALVFNQNLAPNTGEATYYILVWLSETGTDQTANATVGSYVNPDDFEFFMGNVTFVSAQGSEVSATFSSYTRVETVAETPAGA